MRPRLANRLWRVAAWPETRRLERDSSRVAETQRALLARCLSANAETDFGRRHGFDSVTSVADYQSAVPVRAFDDYADDIARIAAGEPDVLTTEPVRRFLPTSGSAGPVKLVPVTRTLQAEQRRALDAWVGDLFARRPELMDGRAYWSVTPPTEDYSRTSGGIAVGFEADSVYLGWTGRLLESSVLAVPDAVKAVTDTAAFRYVTLRFLLAAEDLRVVSVWNPTYLSLLLDTLPEYWEQLLADVSDGRLRPPGPVPPPTSTSLAERLRPDPARAARLQAVGPGDPGAIWPHVGLLSCWTDGPASAPSAALARRWRGVEVQPKGLLATEAFVTVPHVGADGGVLALRSHFFEFAPLDGGAPALAHELESGREYDVLVTTGGGLYRYRLGDRVRVTGGWRDAPCLRFVGRADRVSDWFGEKLSEPFVGSVLQTVTELHGLAPTFAMLAPDDTTPGFRYTLYLDVPQRDVPSGMRAALEADLDERLRAGYHYNVCRRLGQLGPARLVLVPGASDAYIEACGARGQRLGDVKPGALATTTGWGSLLTGGRIAEDPACESL